MSSYYHVVISIKNESDIVLFKDLSKQQLKKKFIKKFKSGKDLFVDNQIFKSTDFSKVTIIKTDLTLDEELEQYHQESLEWQEKANQEPGPIIIGGSGLYEYEIINRGSDVTEQFISAAPKSSNNLISRFFNNPWTIRIIGGVIAMLIVWWLTNHFDLFS